MLRKELLITNKLGLHARASAKLVNTAARFRSKIEVYKDNPHKRVNAKSIMGIMLLAASQNTTLHFIADGEDEAEAMQAIIDLIHDKFGEKE